MKKLVLTIALAVVSSFSFGQKNAAALAASADSIDVTIYVEFDIKKNGKVSNVKIQKTECAECSEELKKALGEEALKAIKAMPPMEDKPEEKIHLTVPISFKIAREEE